MTDRMPRWPTVIALFLLASCSSSSDDGADPRRRCEQLRDHLIDVRLAASDIDLTAHRAAMKQALGDHFVDACASKMTGDQIRCALDAKDQAAADACTSSPPSSPPPPPPTTAKTASK